ASMKALWIQVWLHVALGPLAVFMMVHDYHHPEVWEDWYRHPVISISLSLGLEVFLWGFTVTWVIREYRMAKGLERLREAIKFQKQGRFEESDVAYREGVRLTGIRR